MKSESVNTVFDKVVFIGPSKEGKGGIATVMNQYSKVIEPFNYCAVNSCRGGKLNNLSALSGTLMKLFAFRLRGAKIAHIHYAGSNSWRRENFIARFAKRLGMKTLMHCHCDIERLSEHQGLENVRATLSKADGNVVLANSYRHFAEDVLGLDNVHVVSNFLVGNVAAPGDSKTQSEMTEFLFLGLLIKDKGIFDILDAAALLKKKNLDFRIVFGGVGDMDVINNVVSRLGLNQNVEFAGWMSGVRKDEAVKKCDVFLLPSYTEAMPMSAIEAFMNAKPVIATNVGALPDMITDGKNGFIVKPGDYVALAGAMERFITDRRLLDDAKKASAAKCPDFAPAKVKTQLVDIFKSLLNKN